MADKIVVGHVVILASNQLRVRIADTGEVFLSHTDLQPFVRVEFNPGELSPQDMQEYGQAAVKLLSAWVVKQVAEAVDKGNTPAINVAGASA